MPRQQRYFIPDQPLHVIQRGNNREAIFFADEDYGRYREWLKEAASKHRCAIHAYVFMTNHVHLLVTPENEESLPATMQSLGRRYVGYVNWAYQRTGTLMEGRYRAAPIDSDAYFLACCRYIELNPVRARMTSDPGHYPWSSYHAHPFGTQDGLTSDHPLYRMLGASAPERQAAYRDLFRSQLPEDFVAELRAATNGGWAFGNECFKHQIAKALKRRVVALSKGRPPKPRKDARQLGLF